MTQRAFRSVRKLFPLLALLVATTTFAQSVYVVEITGEVDLGLAPYVRRVIDEAEQKDAAAILLHVNTFGGRLDVATEIRDAIMNTSIPTIAFVDKRAISAGALISLAADKIAMAPGSSIGAATPVDASGETASDKVISYMRGEMRATAERNGRNPLIAEAMVDQSIGFSDSLSSLARRPSGSLLTLTAVEAQRVGFSDGEAASIEEALEAFGITYQTIERPDANWGEELVSFVTLPFISSLLIMLGLAGLFYAIKTGHFGIATLVGISSIALFFSAQYVAELASLMEIALFLLGVALLIAEIFIIPGIGVAGVAGLICIISALFLALIGSLDLVTTDTLAAPLYALAGGLVGFCLLAWVMVRFLPNSSAFRRFALYGESVGSDAYALAEMTRSRELLGKLGVVLTTLRPAGTASFDDEVLDVLSDGSYIPAGEHVEIVKVEGRKVVVRRIVAIEGDEIIVESDEEEASDPDATADAPDQK